MFVVECEWILESFEEGEMFATPPTCITKWALHPVMTIAANLQWVEKKCIVTTSIVSSRASIAGVETAVCAGCPLVSSSLLLFPVQPHKIDFAYRLMTHQP
jgi:hypothetical protein